MDRNRERASHQLLCQLVRCPEVDKAGAEDTHPCSGVVRFQDRIAGEFQPPTPWIGRLSEAPILFIGSNPNISGTEHYPEADCQDEDLVSFFDRAFEGEDAQIQDGIRPRKADGGYGVWVRTWAGVRGRAGELLGRDPTPGRDYAMTEIVHCRSWDEIGVDGARDHCANLYLDRILQVSPAKVVVGFGAHVNRWLRQRWGLDEGRLSQVTIQGTPRFVALLPHPTSRGSKTFRSLMADELPILRAALGSGTP